MLHWGQINRVPSGYAIARITFRIAASFYRHLVHLSQDFVIHLAVTDSIGEWFEKLIAPSRGQPLKDTSSISAILRRLSRLGLLIWVSH